MRQNQKITLSITALTIVAVMITATTYAALSTSLNLSSNGAVDVSANLEVYSNSECTIPLTAINWETLTPGESRPQTIYLKNTGNVPLTLSMTTTNWDPPSANGPITITWNKGGTVLPPGQSTPATITLSVNSGISETTAFTVQIRITGT